MHPIQAFYYYDIHIYQKKMLRILMNTLNAENLVIFLKRWSFSVVTHFFFAFWLGMKGKHCKRQVALLMMSGIATLGSILDSQLS